MLDGGMQGSGCVSSESLVESESSEVEINVPLGFLTRLAGCWGCTVGDVFDGGSTEEQSEVPCVG